jgi:hypothetical protein
MKRLLILCLFATSLSAQTFRQVVPIPYNGQNQTAFVVSFQKPTAMPCTLFLVGRELSTPIITDDAGNVWEAAADRGLWYAPCKGATSKVAISFSSSVSFYGVLGEKAGYFDVDVSSITVNGNSNPSASATITTTQADLIIGYGWNYSTMTPNLTAGSGYVLEGQANAFIEDLQQSAPGPMSAGVNFRTGFSGWWVQGVVAFKPALGPSCGQ